jgi:hypothetical protein
LAAVSVRRVWHEYIWNQIGARIALNQGMQRQYLFGANSDMFTA